MGFDIRTIESAGYTYDKKTWRRQNDDDKMMTELFNLVDEDESGALDMEEICALFELSSYTCSYGTYQEVKAVVRELAGVESSGPFTAQFGDKEITKVLLSTHAPAQLTRA